MRHRRSSEVAPQSQSQSGRAFRPSILLRWGLVFMVLIVTAMPLLFNSAGTPGNGLFPAAQPTNPAEAATLNKMQIDLPRTKDEAAAFERQHNSPYNFNQVKALNAAYAKNDTAALNNLEQNAPAPATTPGLGAPLTPAPTATGPSSNNGLTPTPTAGRPELPIKPNGSPGCVNVDPGIAVIDACEVDDTPGQATIIFANDIPQIHNFVPNTASVTDIDWLRFSVTQAYVPYTITVTPRPGVTITLSLTLFDPTASTVISSSGPANGPLVIGNFLPTTADTFYLRVLPSSPFTTGMETRYDIKVVTGPPQPTPTPTSTSLSGGSATAVPCRDNYEDDNSPGNAKLIKPSISDTPPFAGTPGAPALTVGAPAAPTASNLGAQFHYICPDSDVDWVYMDLVKGKPYSVFTNGLGDGLDTFMILYIKDAAGNLVPLYSSDDFPGMGLASRIDWIVPTTPDTPLGTTARYYLALKDVAGHGGLNLQYYLYLTSPGNGLGDCFDQYEPDNNPTQSKEILLNESQSHAFCPTGDRDWVRFYAKAGRLYNVSTSSIANGVIGLDTSLYIWQVSFDPNDPGKVTDQRLIGQNDDKSDADLNSSVNFSVPGDGYYYAEVRNAGDIGHNGMYYSLRFSTAAGAPNDVPATQTAAARLTAAVPTAASTATPTGTTSSSSATVDALLSRMRFTDPGFQRLWIYSDLVVALGRAQRSWEWGPLPLASKLEAYFEASGATRQVQYFDKARMEINNPKGDRTSKWFVSNGLLVKEMVTGWLALGDTQAELHSGAEIAVAGDLAETNKAPTYAAMLNLITQNSAHRAEDRTGKSIAEALSKDGTVSNLKTTPEQIKLATYIKETGHNIPTVFWNYLNSKGTIFDGTDYKQDALRDWVFSMGLPLSEPFWVKAQVGGVEKDVLVQLFERRVLTYTPSNTPEWRVEMSNVGQHYYLWRYNAKLE